MWNLLAMVKRSCQCRCDQICRTESDGCKEVSTLPYADEAMALALFTILENGEQIATISESTSYLEGVRSGKIIAKGKVVKKGRHVAFTEGCVKKADGDETVLSQTRASFAVIKKP